MNNSKNVREMKRRRRKKNVNLQNLGRKQRWKRLPSIFKVVGLGIKSKVNYWLRRERRAVKKEERRRKSD